MNEASILFSGGPDSTLAALIALEKFERVHLLTFHHRFMNLTGKHTKVSNELKKIFGEKRVLTHSETIDGLYRKCYFTGLGKYLSKYRTYYIPWLCGSCKLAMHIKTIEYNKKNNIEVTYDGANLESAPYFPAQTMDYINVLKDIYRSYGMEYDCPVYHDTNTDDKTTDYGMTSTKDTKKEHIFFSTQHTCFTGLLIHAHARFYYRPLRDKNRTNNLSGEFLSRIVNDFNHLMPKK